MPKGKVFSPVLIQQQVGIPTGVNVRLLRKKYADCDLSLSKKDLFDLRNQIRGSVSKYVANIKATYTQTFLTGTELKRELEQLINAAQNFLEGLNTANYKKQFNWKHKLSRRLYDLNPTSRNIVYKHFDYPRDDALYLRKALDNIVFKGFDQLAQDILKKIIDIDVSLIDKIEFSRSCQSLQHMVFTLIPIWEFATNKPVKLYTPNHSKKNRDDKSFHTWLFEMLSVCDAPRPSVKQIDQVIKNFRNSQFS